MKNLLFSIFLLVGLSASAQEPELRTELVLHCRDLNPSQVEVIRKQLNCLPGVHLAGYYLPAKCLFITYDADKIAKTGVITNVLIGLNKKLKASTVKGYTIYDIIDKGLPPSYLKTEHEALVFGE